MLLLRCDYSISMDWVFGLFNYVNSCLYYKAYKGSNTLYIAKQCGFRIGFLNLYTVDILGGYFYLVVAVQCIIGCLVTSLICTHQMSVESPLLNHDNKNIAKNYKMFPGGKLTNLRTRLSLRSINHVPNYFP
jgi:hypothetical protein